MSKAVSGLRNLASNVLNGVKLWLFLPVRAEEVRTSWSQLVALIVLGLAATFATNLAQEGLEGHFFASGLPYVLFYVPLTLFAAWTAASLARRSGQTLTLTIALLALAVPFEVIDALCRLALSRVNLGWMRWFAYAIYRYLPYFWLALAATVAVVRILAVPLRAGGYLLLVTGVLLALPQAEIVRMPIWMPADDENRASRSNSGTLVSEDAFYLQTKLLEHQLADLKRGRKGTVDLYFVGLAGDAKQDVFMKEIDAAAKLFGERFDTDGRMVRLINNAKSLAQVPIASVTGLKMTLARVAQVMDSDEDILLLYLTSHGSQDHHFSLEFWPMNFNTLDPATLRKLLDDSGIKRRVIVVSSCYSGAFIDALKDENSLIITASASDKVSFGCSDDADFTYFGKAYIDQALRETYSFTKAFEKAKSTIAAREKKEGYGASEPQIFTGRNIELPLAALEARLTRQSIHSAAALSHEKGP